MAIVDGFKFDPETGNLAMYTGDTGSFAVKAERSSGDPWPDTARMLFTVKDGGGNIVMQRIYRLDDQWDLGDGVVLIEFHNDDTDEWTAGSYTMERRYDLTPIWDGTPSSARCVDALAAGAAQMIEGDVVRTVFKGTISVSSVDGRI